MILPFEHRQSAHCENGTTANLLRFHGLEVSEPMVFGIGAGIFFAYLPFVTVNGAPGLSFRILPGQIFARATRRLGIGIRHRRFRDAGRAMDSLDDLLEQKIPAGCVVGVYHLPYFPPAYRFHFNAHNLVCYGRENGRYLVSDPIMEAPTELSREEFSRVRFARGVFAPRGHQYHISRMAARPDLKRAVTEGIRQACRSMLGIPVPLFGVRGIRFMARRLTGWEKREGTARAAIFLGQVIRMQEEIGTGGGGFRFIYAAFLQEAAPLLGDSRLEGASVEMTAVGDDWRAFAVEAARVCKDRGGSRETYAQLAARLMAIADREEALFRRLSDI